MFRKSVLLATLVLAAATSSWIGCTNIRSIASSAHSAKQPRPPIPTEYPEHHGNLAYLTTNGRTIAWGNIATGHSGALDCTTEPGTCDIVTAIVPLKPAANDWIGLNNFRHLKLAVFAVADLPKCDPSFEGEMEGVKDADSPAYLQPIKPGGISHVPVYCDGKTWVAH